MSVLSDKEHSPSETRQRAHLGRSKEEYSTEVTSVTDIREPFWVYVNLSSIILVLSSHLTHPWILPKMHAQILLRWIPLERPMNVCLYLLWGGVPSFATPKKPSCACADRKIFLDLRSGHLISLL